MQPAINLQEWFSGIDIYLFDQLLKGRIVPGMKVLDAGCGVIILQVRSLLVLAGARSEQF